MTQEPVRLSTAAPTGQSPLRRFKGILGQYAPEKVEFSRQDGTPGSFMVAVFDFKEVEVIESTEPYPFPIAQVRIGYAPPTSSFGKSRWEALASSVRKLVPDGELDALVGKRQEWAVLPCTLNQRLTDEDGNVILNEKGRPKYGDVEGESWQIVSVDGLGSVAQVDADFNAYLSALADGKTEQQFYEAALTDQQVITKPTVVKALTDRVLLDTLIAAERITRDTEGVLHKVQS